MALYDTRLVLGQSPAAEGTHAHVTLLVTAWSLAMPAVMREQAMHHLSQAESVQTWAQPLDLAPGQVCVASAAWALVPFPFLLASSPNLNPAHHPRAVVRDVTGGAAGWQAIHPAAGPERVPAPPHRVFAQRERVPAPGALHACRRIRLRHTLLGRALVPPQAVPATEALGEQRRLWGDEARGSWNHPSSASTRCRYRQLCSRRPVR
jgi:hypothetical protein